MSAHIEAAIRRHRQEKRIAWVAALSIGAFAMGGLAVAQNAETHAKPAETATPAQPAPAPRVTQSEAPQTQSTPPRAVRVIAIAGYAPAPLVATR